MSEKVLVSRRLLFALISHAQECAKMKLQAAPGDAYYVVLNHLMNAAEARLIVDRADGKRR